MRPADRDEPKVNSKIIHQRRALLRAFAGAALILLPSCGIPRLRQPEPGPALPAEYHLFPGGKQFPPGTDPYGSESEPIQQVSYSQTGSSQPMGDSADPASIENSAQLSFEEFFDDPVLSDLIYQGLARNQELRILNEEIQIARNEYLARRRTYWPFIDFGARWGLDKPSLFTPLGAAEDQLEAVPGVSFPDPLPDYQLGFTFLWRLDIWRELRNARDAAWQRYLAAIEKRNFFVTRLVAEIAESYYKLLALDNTLSNLARTVRLQSQALEVAKARLKAGRGTALAVQRFEAAVRKNQAEMQIVRQQIIEVENRVNFLINRLPQPVERRLADFADFLNLNIHTLAAGIPPQLLLNRPDIRQAERELIAAGLDVRVARAHFFPRLDLTAGVGYQAFQPKFLFTPESLVYNVAGDLVVPVINRAAIRAEYRSANAAQLQAVYNYQRTVLNAFTEVVNRLSKVQNFTHSIERKKLQINSLEDAVESANKLFKAARVEYIEVLLAQRDLQEARAELIEIKQEQLAAIVNTYQALGGAWRQYALARRNEPHPCYPCSSAASMVQVSVPATEETLPEPRRLPVHVQDEKANPAK
ncbi:MAG: hypothetical protein KatS3mg105_1170 [Gemmatales bacterium]|nr:MAG: hypothetical protein KatS3mg105_1170 [Gemmatales bacterium]